MKLRFLPSAEKEYLSLQNDPSQIRVFKDVCKTLAFMEINGEKVFEAYAQQKVPGAYRIFWYYGPDKNMISIVAITAHP